MQKLITRSLAGMAFATLFYGSASYADGPPEAYDNGAPAQRNLKPGDYLVNADGAKEDPNARMSEIARAYRNGWIHRGNTDDRILKDLIQKQHDANMAAARAAIPPVSGPPPAAPAQTVRRYLPPPPPSSYVDAPPPAQYAPQMYAQPMYAEPPAPVQPVQYVPVYPPAPPVYQQYPQAVYAAPPGWPVVAVASAYPVVQAGYYRAPWWYGGGYRRWR
ncbi:hypothetical protein [Paraburkholderia dinghuensis]|nr:hypothetical protein [Paraburkholderia dinghuensis]